MSRHESLKKADGNAEGGGHEVQVQCGPGEFPRSLTGRLTLISAVLIWFVRVALFSAPMTNTNGSFYSLVLSKKASGYGTKFLFPSESLFCFFY